MGETKKKTKKRKKRRKTTIFQCLLERMKEAVDAESFHSRFNDRAIDI